MGLGLAWAAGDVGLVRDVIAGLTAKRLASDAILVALKDASREG